MANQGLRERVAGHERAVQVLSWVAAVACFVAATVVEDAVRGDAREVFWIVTAFVAGVVAAACYFTSRTRPGELP